MATDNTVEIGFTADTSDFNDGVAAAGDAVEALQTSFQASFASSGDAIQSATQPLQALSTALGQVRDSLANISAAQAGGQVQQATAGMAAAMQRYDQAVIDGAAKAADAQITTAQAAVNEKKALGQISADSAIQQLEALATQENEVNQQRIASMREVYQAMGNGAGVARSDADQVAQTERYTQQMAKLQEEAAQQSQQAWEKSFQPISKAFESTIDGMVRGTQTFQQAVQHAAQNVEAEFVNSAAQSLTKWLAAEAAKTTANQAGNTARVSNDQEGEDQSLLSHIASAAKHILTDAAQVFGNVYAYLSDDIGPFAAIPAAASAAAVLAVELPSAAGGWVVPNDTLAMVHQNEMILPAHLSQGIAGMIAGGPGGGGGHTFNNTFNVHSGDGVTARQLPDMIVKTMSKAMRNGQFGGMRTA